MGEQNGILRLQHSVIDGEDRYAKITSPFLFKMKNTLQHNKLLTANRRLIKEVFWRQKIEENESLKRERRFYFFLPKTKVVQ